jgi:FSR family fosmidomycin resistance protein-like MFS transporter
VFLAAVALGTIIGGPIGDRIGRKRVIWVSILGVAPIALLIPLAGLVPTILLSALAGLVMASAFPAIIVYAQDLMPAKVGLVAGLFFGLAFGLGGLGAAGIGMIADATSIAHAFWLCSFLPLIGVLAVFLPDLKRA